MKIFSNTPPARESNELQKHFSQTYFALRAGLATLALSMPLVLYLAGKWIFGLDLQPSMSAYFWVAADGQCASFPMRTVFVGYLFAIGVCLYAYKGLTPLENALLNAAAVSAVVVAIVPTRLLKNGDPIGSELQALFDRCPDIKTWADSDPSSIHFYAAAFLFILLAIVAWFCANKSLEYLPSTCDADVYRKIYKTIAAAMFLFPFIGFGIAHLFGQHASVIFFIEFAGITIFGIYWIVKSRELSLSSLEKSPAEAIQHCSAK